MSFRPGRALASDEASPSEREAAGPDDDPALVAIVAGRDLDLRPLLGAALVLLGGLLGIALVVVLGAAVFGLVGLRAVWERRGLRGIRIERRFDPDRVTCGDDARLVLVAWNRRLLPIPWLRVEEPLPPELVPSGDGRGRGWTVGVRKLVNGWTLGPYERVVRRIDLRTARRGVYRLATFGVAAGDLFGEPVADEERTIPASLIVRPRTVPMRRFEAARERSGAIRARHGLFDDPSRFAGIRPYAPGDPIRHVHWRTSARLGRIVMKRFDPSRDRDVVIALDVQTTDGAWAGRHDDDLVETLCVVAASLARGLEAEGAACGLALAAFTGTTDRIAFLAPSAAERQSGRIGDLLARSSPYPSAPFEHLLGRLPRMVRPGTLVAVVSARDPRPFLPVARRLARSGFGVVHLAVGPEAAALAARSRAVGLTGRVARLDSDWRTARTLDVAG